MSLTQIYSFYDFDCIDVKYINIMIIDQNDNISITDIWIREYNIDILSTEDIFLDENNDIDDSDFSQLILSFGFLPLGVQSSK